MGRKMIEETIFLSGYSSPIPDAMPVGEFIGWLQGLTAPVSPDWVTMIEFGDDGDWDGPRPQLYIWKERMETEEEALLREEKEIADERRNKEREIEYARYNLARLEAAAKAP